MERIHLFATNTYFFQGSLAFCCKITTIHAWLIGLMPFKRGKVGPEAELEAVEVASM